GPGIANRVVLEDQAAGLAADANAGGSTFDAVIFDQVLLQAVAVPGHALGFIAEKDAVFMVAADSVVPQQGVGVLVADRDAEAAVAFKQVLFKEAILDAPAEEQAVFAVVPGAAAAHRGPLRAAAWMNAQGSVVLADAGQHADVVALLEADAVAGVV